VLLDLPSLSSFHHQPTLHQDNKTTTTNLPSLASQHHHSQSQNGCLLQDSFRRRGHRQHCLCSAKWRKGQLPTLHRQAGSDLLRCAGQVCCLLEQRRDLQPFGYSSLYVRLRDNRLSRVANRFAVDLLLQVTALCSTQTVACCDTDQDATVS
jgi:hypothetical protein